MPKETTVQCICFRELSRLWFATLSRQRMNAKLRVFCLTTKLQTCFVIKSLDLKGEGEMNAQGNYGTMFMF